MSKSFEHQSFWQNAICKQCRPRSDCSWRSSLIRVFTVWHSTKHFKRQMHKKAKFQPKKYEIKCLKFKDFYHKWIQYSSAVRSFLCTKFEVECILLLACAFVFNSFCWQDFDKKKRILVRIFILPYYLINHWPYYSQPCLYWHSIQ